MSTPPDAIVIIIPANVGGTTSPPYGQHNYPWPPPYPGIYITATPSPGYILDHFNINGVIRTENPVLVSLTAGLLVVVHVYWHAIIAHIVTASHADYVSKTATVAVVGGAVSTLDFVLYPQHVTLYMAKTGEGTTDPPVGEHLYDYDEVNAIEATAYPAAGYWFENWFLYPEEQYDGSNPIRVLPNKDRALVANFATSTVLLTITKTGEGTTDPPEGTNTIAFDNVNTIQVTAYPASGYRFDSWLVDEEFNYPLNPIEILPNRNYSLRAIFVPEYTLTISTTAGGTTDPAPGSYSHADGATVTINAMPEAGYRLAMWMLDDVIGNPPSITVTMDRNHALEAVFEPIPPGKGVLQCHAHVDGGVASATVKVAGVAYTTPFSLELDPGNYTLNATYSGQSQTKTATIVEGETTTVNFQFTKPPPPKKCPFKNLESFPRLHKFLCDIWAKQ